MERIELLKAIVEDAYMSEEQIDSRINEFILANTKAKSVRFNIHNFCNEKSSYEHEHGIYHENGYKYGCLGYALVCIKDAYTNAYDRRVVTKKGKILDKDTRHPDYSSVKPEKCEKYAFNVEAANELIKRAAVYKTTLFYAKLGESVFPIHSLKLMVQFYKAFTPSTVGFCKVGIFMQSDENWFLCCSISKIPTDATVVTI